MHASRTAFTLVELAIVLVIIGLIVGGVLVGQDLIRQAAGRAQLTQLQKYDQAVNAFRTKYGGIPGDLSIDKATQNGFAVPSSCTGQKGGRDGNGAIDGFNDPGNTGQIYPAVMGENALFWNDLNKVGFIDGRASGNTISTICTAANNTPSLDRILPEGKIGFATYLHVYEVNGVNWYQLAAATQSNISSLNITGSIPVMLARDMDGKIDDGLPATGNVKAYTITPASQVSISPMNAQASDSATSCYNNSNNRYSVSFNGGDGANCSLSFRFQ